MDFLSVLLCLVIPSLLLVFAISKKSSRFNLPPSPPSLPVIGHLHLAGKEELPHHFFNRLSAKYGPVVYLRLGLVQAIVVSDSSTAKEVLHTQGLSFASRPPIMMAQHIAYGSRDIGTSPYRTDVREMKAFLIKEIAMQKNLFSAVRADEISCLVSELRKASLENKSVELRPYLSAMSYNIITRVAMSKRYCSEEMDVGEAGNKLKAMLREVIKFGLNSTLADFFPGLELFDRNVRKMKEVHKIMDGFLQAVVDEHKTKKHNDILNTMLTTVDSDERAKVLLFDIINGGSETSSTVLEWCLAQLMNNPKVLHRAQHELDEVVGRAQQVQQSDIANLRYLQAVVKETFRLNPPLPLLVPHSTSEACTLQGYTIPAGTWTFVNVHAIGRDPKVWDEPLTFRPERFLEGPHQHVGVHGRDFELVPFGSGHRSCPGLAMGLLNVHLTLATLLHTFDWTHHGEVDLREAGGTNNLDLLLHPLKASLVVRNVA